MYSTVYSFVLFFTFDTSRSLKRSVKQQDCIILPVDALPLITEVSHSMSWLSAAGRLLALPTDALLMLSEPQVLARIFSGITTPEALNFPCFILSVF